jgi:hypothetical protein
MKIQRTDVMYLYLLLQNLPSLFEKMVILYDKRLLYYVDTIKSKFKDISEACIALRTTTEPSAEYLEFGKLKTRLENKYFYTLPDGTSVLNESNKEEFNVEFQKLIDTYGRVVIEHDSYCNKVGVFLQETVEIDFESIPFVLIPNTLPQEYYNELMLLCRETPEAIKQIVEKGLV